MRERGGGREKGGGREFSYSKALNFVCALLENQSPGLNANSQFTNNEGKVWRKRK
jgi:hypothetical protein